MNLPMLANSCADAAALQLDHVDIPAEQVVSGNPRVGTAVLGELGGCAIGVWEITPGVSTDVESEEFFIVLSGQAMVAFADGRPALCLGAGSISYLAAGTATIWTVTETLRKIYLI